MTNAQTTIREGTVWERPTEVWTPSDDKGGRSKHDFERWQALTERTAVTAETHGWTKAEVSRRSGVASGTFTQWYNGKYSGRFDTVNKEIGQWLDGVEESSAFKSIAVKAPPFQNMRTAQEVLSTLQYAHSFSKLVAITLESGMGKTFTCKHYCNTRPHAYRVVMRPNIRNVHGMLVEIAAQLGLVEHNPAKLDRAIKTFIDQKQVPVLLVIDEAQNLIDLALDQLRYFSDEAQCGIALVGNNEIYTKLRGKDTRTYAQIKRRFAKTLKRTRPYAEDIASMISAWGVSEPEEVTFLRGIGNKPGALGNISETMEFASMIAAGDGTDIQLRHIQFAWQNRPTEDLG